MKAENEIVSRRHFGLPTVQFEVVEVEGTVTALDVQRLGKSRERIRATKN